MDRSLPLRRLREHCGLTVQEMAQSLGISRQFVYQLEAGSQHMGLATARKILHRYPAECEVLGIVLEALVLEPRERLSPDDSGGESAA